MSATTTGTGLKRLQHLVLWVSNVERSVRFYCDVVGFEVKRRYPNAAFLVIPGTSDDHHLGLFEQTGVPRPDERVARMYHSAWEVGDLTELARAKRQLVEAGALVGSSNHGVSLSLYAKDPDGLEFEIHRAGLLFAFVDPGYMRAALAEFDQLASLGYRRQL